MKASGIGSWTRFIRHNATVPPTAAASEPAWPASAPGVIGGAVLRAARRSSGLTRNTLALILVVPRATVQRWERGTLPLYTADYGTLRRLAAATGADLRELLIAQQCDLLLTSMLAGDEDFADVPPIDDDTPDGATARRLLSRAFTDRALIADTDVQRIAAIARRLAEGAAGPDLARFGTALLRCTTADASGPRNSRD